MDLRDLQLEHDALLIAGWTAQPVLYSSRLSDEQHTRAQPLHDLLRRKSLLGIDAFNKAAWLGDDGILAKWRASEWRRHIGASGGIKVITWGIAGGIGCILVRGDEKVVLRGIDRPGSPVGFSESTAVPRVAAELIWQAADHGRWLAAALVPEDVWLQREHERADAEAP